MIKEMDIKFLLLLTITGIVSAKDCPKNRFPSSFTGECSECPEKPSIDCKNEGFDAKACEEECIVNTGGCEHKYELFKANIDVP